jgi:putative membrane protein
MGKLILRWIILTAAIIASSYLTDKLLPGQFTVSYETAGQTFQLMIGAAVFALVNQVLGPFLKLVLLPLNCLTLGLFSIVINAGLLYWVGQWGLGFSVTSFWAAVVGSLLIGLVNGALGGFVKNEDDED